MKWRDVLRNVGATIGEELDRRSTPDLRTFGSSPFNNSPCGGCGYLHCLSPSTNTDEYGVCLVDDVPVMRRKEGVITSCKRFGNS